MTHLLPDPPLWFKEGWTLIPPDNSFKRKTSKRCTFTIQLAGSLSTQLEVLPLISVIITRDDKSLHTCMKLIVDRWWCMEKIFFVFFMAIFEPKFEGLVITKCRSNPQPLEGHRSNLSPWRVIGQPQRSTCTSC